MIYMGLATIVFGFLALPVIWLLVPFGFYLTRRGNEQKELALERRKHAKAKTGSVLMSKADYVGGHPLLPEAGPVVLGLSATEVTIYTIGAEHAIRPAASIGLDEIVQAETGTPKSLHRAYSQDHGYTLEIKEESPFLRVEFELQGDTYHASLQSFEREALPQVWYNQIYAHKYRFKSGQS